MKYQHLFLDYETCSLEDLKVVGLDNYLRHPSTRILMLAWACDREEVEIWFPHLGPPPQKLLDAWRDPTVTKIAWNAEFEFSATKHVLPRQCGITIDCPLSEYRDPIVLAHNLSLPGYLDDAAEILHMAQQKDPHGDQLKEMFCSPVSKGGQMTLFGIAPPIYRTHETHPEEFMQFGEYCKQDVRAERDFWYKVVAIPFPERDWQGWLLNEKINQRGMPARRDLAETAFSMAERFIGEQKQRLAELTGLENPNSDQQMKPWLSARGYEWNSLRANYVQATLDDTGSKLTPEAREALELRQKTKKSSYKKLERLLDVLSENNRLCYQFKYMAAARTGRWAGGDVQVQNMPRGIKAVTKRLDLALKLLEAKDYDGLIKEFTDKKKKITIIDVIITLLRSMFQATPGNKLAVADLNAIENRVLGWVAGCKAILDVFRTCNDCGYLDEKTQGNFHCPKCGCKKARCPYLSFGTRLFHKDYKQMWEEYINELTDERQLSKPAVLGAGYGLGGGEMIVNEFGDEVRGGLWGYAKNVCGVDMEHDLAHEAVKIFRESYPEVVQLWTDLEEAFKQVLMQGGVIKVGEVSWDRYHHEWVKHKTCLGCVITFRRIKMAEGEYMIRMELPSGRALHYVRAQVDAIQKQRRDRETGELLFDKNGAPLTYTWHQLSYEGIEHSATQDANGHKAKQSHQWGRVKTYGGKLTENAVQAISRDLLLNGMTLADEMGFEIFGLFHDELATEVPIQDFGGLHVKDLVDCMSEVPFWAPGLILGAEGYESQVYKKA